MCLIVMELNFRQNKSVMSLKKDLLEKIESAIEIASKLEQTIEIRSALKNLNQSHGLVSISTPEEKEKIPKQPKKILGKGGVKKK